MNGKGNILYTYDAGGNKLKKVTMDSTSRHSTTTLYLDGFVYQQNDTITQAGNGVDTLQFMGHEEGRARWAFHKYKSGSTGYGWEYDFFEKDHLGNTRVLLSQQKDTAQYLASMESAYRNTENTLFYNIPQTAYARASASGYPVSLVTTNPNDSVIRVNGSGQKLGPAIILKVISGDKVDIGVNYYYNSSGATNGQSLSVSDIINSLASGIVSAVGPSHGSAAVLSGGSSPLNGALSSYLTANNPNTTGKPNAYLNWILLDNQFSYVSGYPQSGALQVGASGTATGGVLQAPLSQTGIPITKSGYLYIYVSNATPGWDVFFDNLSVTTYAGPMVEENHYYPFGLTMAGISDKALKTGYAENKYRYNKGSELQNKEFSDGSGLETYETHFRELDPQLGRWWQIDPKCDASINPNAAENENVEDESEVGGLESVSPYMSMGNDPIKHNDPKGDVSCCVTAQEFIQATMGLADESDPEVAIPVEVVGTVITAGIGVVEYIAENPGDGNAFIPLNAQAATARNHQLYGYGQAATPPKAAAPSTMQVNAKKGPKDLAQEGKDAIAKREADKARVAQRQAQTAQGKVKEGKSNQVVRGDHDTGAKRGDKHGKRIERGQREQKAADAAKEAAKKKNNSNG